MMESLRNFVVAPHTHYRIGGIAREVYFPENADELAGLLRVLRKRGTEYFILGGGSNVLVGDGFWDGAVVFTTRLDGVTAGADSLVCGAGLPSSRVAEIARDHGRSGLEFLYLLPGTIGGALAGNARYDMKNVSDVLVSVAAVHPEYDARTFLREEISFAYKRTSIVADGWILAELTLSWEDGDPAKIAGRMAAIERARTTGHHFEYPSCGCVFKNDHARNVQAGRLIDSLGLKGMREGGAEVSPYHANFIVNTGNATARDVRTLIERVEDIARERAGVELEREVRFVGNFD